MKAGSVLSTESGGIDDRLTHIPLPLANPIGRLLAMDTTAGPRHSREAFWADLPLAVRTGSKAAMVNPLQRGVYLAQQGRLTIHVSSRQFPLLRILNLIHLIRALFDCNAVPVSQCVSQFRLFTLEGLLEPSSLRSC